MFCRTFTVLALALLSSLANAALIEAGFPPPGGVTYSSTGSSPDEAHAGGLTWHFSAFDPAAYDELYYSVKWLGLGENSADPMTFDAGASNLANGVSVWTNTFDFYNAQTGITQTVNGAFTLTVTDALDNPLALTDAASIGEDGNLGGMLNVAGDFNANWLFTINGTAALDWYDSQPNGPANHLWTSVGGSFFYSEVSQVPLPAAAWLFGSAVLGLGVVGRRRS